MGSCPCTGRLTWTLRRDVDRYLFQLYAEVRLSIPRILRIMVLFPGLWVVVAYRLTHHCLYRVHPKLLARILAACFFFIQRFMTIVFGIEISAHAHVGAGFFINHFGGVHIGLVTIGSNCNISHGATIGRSTFGTGSNLC